MFWILIPTFFLLDFFWWWRTDRRLRPLRHARPWRWTLAAFMTAMIGYLVLSLLWASPLHRSGGLPVVFHTFVYLWHFLALPITAMFFAARALWKRFQAARAKPRAVEPFGQPANPIPPAPVEIASSSIPHPTSGFAPTRRQMLAAAAMTIPPLATGITSVWSSRQLYGRRLRSFTLSIPQLPRQLDGMTIAHVSDTHIGKFLSPDRLPAIAEDINKLDADFIAFTGDLIDMGLEDLPYGIDFLRSLKSRCGLVVCEGNHDIMQNRGDFELAMRDADLPIILGDQRTIPFTSRDGRSHAVQFLAVPYNGDEPEMADAVNILKPEVRPDAFPILLAHHPHSFDPAAAANFPLILSGHTHGGQIMITSQFGAGSIRFRYTSGLYEKPGSKLIVNNGLGNWFPLRINAPAELVHITLRSTV